MKKLLKCLSVILVMLITLFSFSITALAQATEQDGLQVSLTTDKQSYSLNEDIEITVSVTNTNDFTVEDVSIEALLPDNFELKDSSQKTSTKDIDLKAGENITLKLTALVKGEEQTTEPTTNPTEPTKPVEPSTEPSTEPTTESTTNPTTNPTENTKPSETTTQNSTTSTTETTTKVNTPLNVKETTTNNNNKSQSTTEKTNSVKNSKNGKSPYTGTDYALLAVFFVIFFFSVSGLFYCLIVHTRRTKKAISSVLCLVIAVTSVIGFTSYKAYADDREFSTITISEEIKVDNIDYTISANVKYLFDNTNTLTGRLYLSQDSCNVGEKTDVTFYFEVHSGEVNPNTNINLYIDEKLVGVLNNNGINGDTIENDNIFSGTFSMFSDKRKTVLCSVDYRNEEVQEQNIRPFYYEAPRTDIEQKTIDDFYIDISNIKDKYRISEDEKNNNENLALSKAENCYNEIVKYLQNRSDIEKFGFSGFNIMVNFDFGITVGIPFEDLVVSNTTINKLRSVNARKSYNATSLYKSKIATLQPCYSDLKTTAFDDAAYNMSKKNDNYIFLSNYDDQQVTVETMKSLSNYGIIIIDSHGGNWENYGYVFSLSEVATPEKNEKYTKSGDLGKTIIDNGGYYVLTQAFFDKYYSENDFNNTVIYLGTCHGGDDNVLIKDIFKEKGAEAVMCFKNEVVSKYNREMITTISERLTKGDTIQKAVEKAKQEHGDHDPYLTSDVYNQLDFWNKVWYNLGFIESSNPAELILTGNDTSFKLSTNPTVEQITGQVIDVTDNAPISNVKISCEELNISCKTDKSGKFSFDLSLPLSEHTFTFEHNDYKQKSITINADDYSKLNKVILEQKDGSVSGCVKEASNSTPIKNVEVRALDESGTVIEKTKTDENGNFTLSLPAGKYTLNIGGELGATSEYSYETYTTDVTVDSNVWTVLKEDILLNRATMRIAGNVYDSESKEPLADVEVKAYQVVNGTSEYVSSGTSNTDGEYVINISKNGTYDLEFTKTGYTTATQNAIMTFGNLTYADWQYLVKDNTNSDTVFAGGNGTEANPYQVSTPEQLNAIRNDLSAHYIQINDIDMSNWGNWEPIGNAISIWGGAVGSANYHEPTYTDNYFTGVYDGGNYKISNLTLNNNTVSVTEDSFGLFSGLKNSTVKNLTLSNISYNINKETTDYASYWTNQLCSFSLSVGGIAGRCDSSTISNCSVDGEINVINCSDAYVGGISGIGNTISNCNNNTEIYVNANKDSRYKLDSIVYCGGITGCTRYVNSSKIISCKNYGNIRSTSGAFAYCGGISGECGYIDHCFNYGNVTGNVINHQGAYNSFAGTSNVGGIVGATSSDNTSYCLNYGNISSCAKTNDNTTIYLTSYAGGIVGYCGYYGSGNINNCYNYNNIIVSQTKDKDDNLRIGYAGRIAGYSIKTSDCYSINSTTINGSIPTESITPNSINGGSLTKKEMDEKIKDLV
ncbi:MAG: carboxypeptidase regulatory-like domain-containing protein [Clostridium sp.]|nr:carboxypeptidase regulatory-like domain-containing protein [Clostridium sp.]